MIERPTIIFAYVEHSQYQEVWVDSYYAGCSGLWNSNSFRRLKKIELPKNVIAMETPEKMEKMGQKLIRC